MAESKTTIHTYKIQITGTNIFNRITQAVLDNLKYKHPRVVRKLRRAQLVIEQTSLSDGTYAQAFQSGAQQHITIDSDQVMADAGEAFDGTDVLIGVLIDQLVRLVLDVSTYETVSEQNAAADTYSIKLGFDYELTEFRNLESYIQDLAVKR